MLSPPLLGRIAHQWGTSATADAVTGRRTKILRASHFKRSALVEKPDSEYHKPHSPLMLGASPKGAHQFRSHLYSPDEVWAGHFSEGSPA